MRPRLDRARILQAGVEFVEGYGVRRLTMRRLGSELGVEGMSLYRHLPSRDSLLDGIVETVMDELYEDPEVDFKPVHGWREYLIRLAHGLRRLALRRPRAFPLLEVSTLGADVGPVEEAEPRPPLPADLAGYPILQRLHGQLSVNRSGQVFEESLEDLLGRLEALIN